MSEKKETPTENLKTGSERPGPKKLEPKEPISGTDEAKVQDISPEEAQQLKAMRQAKARREQCAKEIDEVLKKHGALLAINPNSPFGAPQIIVQLR